MTSGALADAWAGSRRKLIKALRRGDRDRFDAQVLGLLALAEGGRSTYDPHSVARSHGLLQIGVATATKLAKHASTDPELLACAVVLPWFDSALLGLRSPLASRSSRTSPPNADFAPVAESTSTSAPARPPHAPAPPAGTAGAPIDWTAAVLLAMVPAEGRATAPSDGSAQAAYVRQLAALPPLLRATVIIERDLAGAAAHAAPFPPYPAQPFDHAQLSLLAADVPRELLPASAPPAGPPPQPPPPPVGSPAEAVNLVRESLSRPFGSYRMVVGGAPRFIVEGRELVYRVRWDAPAEAIRPLGPPVTYPGDQRTVLYREPGWIVDRATRQVHPVDLSAPVLESYVAARRVFPLAPGWRPRERPPVTDGLAVELAAILPAPVRLALGPAIREATARYAAVLATDTWPDYLVAWRIARHTMGILANAGFTDPGMMAAALLAARGTAPTDTLIDETSGLWRSSPGAPARVVRPDDAETHGTGATRRAQRLRDASAEVRALVLANAQARAQVETELFGVTPQARLDELAALTMLAGDLPALGIAGG